MEATVKGSIHDNIQRYSMPSAGLYDLVTGLLFRGRYREIARAIAAEAPTGSEVLDVSCGPGTVLVELARMAPTLRTTGVDIDAGMIARAERKAARLATGGQGASGRPRFVVADVAAMPFPDASFDLVVSSYAAHHWPDRHAGLMEVNRVLRPGGRAIIWDIASPHEAEDGGPHGSPDAGASAHRDARPEVALTDAHPSLLGTVRMMLQFRRIPSERYEFTKPA
jgi:ubiquinone/menaquinone biosynthesis C-methylase UbiE